MKIKTCHVCKAAKNVELFALANNSKGGDGRAAFCLECSATLTVQQKTALQTRLWRERNRERQDHQHKDCSLQKTYEITTEQYQVMLQEQHNVCAVCGKPSTTINSKDNRLRSLCVDLDHATGKVRGLLCSRCNTLLELIEQNPQRVEQLRRYLKKHRDA